MNEQKKTVYDHIERHYDQSLGLITHFVTKLADEAVEMTARGVALAAPLPNAISMYNISQKDLGWSWVAALAFAISLEVVVFLLVEIALMMWDGYLANHTRYKAPFIGMIVVVVIAVLVVMGFVFWLEPHKIMAALPIISLCSFIGIGLKRWHERNTETDQMQAELAERNRRIEQLTSEHKLAVDRLIADGNRVVTDHTEQVATLQKALADYENLSVQLTSQHSDQVAMLSEQVQEMAAQLSSLKRDQSPPIPPIQIVRQVPVSVYQNGDIVHGLEHLELPDKIKAVAQRMVDSGQKVNKSRIADLVNCSRTSVQNALG